MQSYEKLSEIDLDVLKKLDIVVLCGGIGTEVEVSLDSGEAVYNALKSYDLNVRKIIADGSEEQILGLDCELVFIALHGKFGEDGTVQGLLERKRIPFIGSTSQVSRLCMDKNLSKTLMQRMSVPVAPWICVSSADKLTDKMESAGLNLPVVIKPNTGGSSVGVVIARDTADIVPAVQDILDTGDSAIIEEYVGGIEFTVGVLDGEPLPIVEMIPADGFYDYHAKYLTDSTRYICPPQMISTDIQAICSDLSREIYRSFKIRDLARIDYILGSNGNLVALEINSIPGFTSHSLLPKAASVNGIEFNELCLEILNMAYLRRS